MTERTLEELDALIVKRLYWQLPIIAMRARKAADQVMRDARVDPDELRRPCNGGETAGESK